MFISINGDDKDNTLTGGVLNELFHAKAGKDHIFTGHGSDTVYAGSGNDVVYNDAGNDLLHGQGGVDTISFLWRNQVPGHHEINGAPVIFDLAKKIQTVFGFGTDTYYGFENVEGGHNNDILYGNSGANNLFGWGGDDILFGRGGNDTIEGSQGKDTIQGGSGRDVLAGTTEGAKYSDGATDVFRFKSLSDSGTSKSTRDVVWGDFNNGASGYDKIELRGIDANPYLNLDQSFTFIGSHSFHEGVTGEVRTKHLGGDKYVVQLNVDFDSKPEMAILVHSQHALTAADFIL